MHFWTKIFLTVVLLITLTVFSLFNAIVFVKLLLYLAVALQRLIMSATKEFFLFKNCDWSKLSSLLPNGVSS